MTRVAVLADVHGNLPALEAVLADPRLATADRIVVLGDVVGGPEAAACIDLLAALGERMRGVRGNAERDVIAAADGGAVDDPSVAVEVDALGPARIAALRALASAVRIDVPGLGPTVLCHGTPRSEDEILTRRSPAPPVAAILADVAERVVVSGHTHVQYDRRVAGRRLVNPGSVGMPYEDEPGARWALLGPDVALLVTAYDAEAAAARLTASSAPGAAAFADAYVRRMAASAEEASAHFERVAATRDGLS